MEEVDNRQGMEKGECCFLALDEWVWLCSPWLIVKWSRVVFAVSQYIKSIALQTVTTCFGFDWENGWLKCWLKDCLNSSLVIR